jgi:hypothetical protein
VRIRAQDRATERWWNTRDVNLKKGELNMGRGRAAVICCRCTRMRTFPPALWAHQSNPNTGDRINAIR